MSTCLSPHKGETANACTNDAQQSTHWYNYENPTFHLHACTCANNDATIILIIFIYLFIYLDA